jgi:hypothetical protein
MEDLPEKAVQAIHPTFEWDISTVADISDFVLQSGDYEKQIKTQMIHERSLALAAVIEQLALRKAEVVEESTHDSVRLIAAAEFLVRSMGMSNLFIVEQKIRADSYAATQFGQMLRAKRRSVGLNQAGLAKIIGVSPPSISLYENGKMGQTGPAYDRLRAFVFEEHEPEVSND